MTGALSPEHVLRKIYHCTFWPKNFSTTFLGFYSKILHFISRKIVMTFLFLLHQYTNSLSSRHIFVHPCTFCASLHVRTSPDSLVCFVLICAIPENKCLLKQVA